MLARTIVGLGAVRFYRCARASRHGAHAAVRFVESLEPRVLLSTSVLTWHDDPAQTGRDLTETVLSVGIVNASSFGKEVTVPLDGQAYAQPLYDPGVSITIAPQPGIHNVVFVATQNDSLYAIDADTGFILWHDAFINPGAGITAVPEPDVNAGDDLTPQFGTTSTPVIDPASNTIYVEAKTKEVRADGAHYVHKLYAVNIADGSEKPGSPVLIADSRGDTYVSGPTINGTGETPPGTPAGKVAFDALRELNRPALTLANGSVYLAFGSHGDQDPYHGWVLGYDATTLAPTAVFNTTPNGSEGAIWQSGAGLAVDSQGHLYAMTGNGTFDENPGGFPTHGDYGDSFLKLGVDTVHNSPSNQNLNGWGLQVLDYFTPSNEAALNASDYDLGSGGPLLLPDEVGSAAHPRLLIGAGKEGKLYLIDRDNMGKFSPAGDQVVQEQGAVLGSAFDTGTYFNHTIYFADTSGNAKAFTISNAHFSPVPTSQSPDFYGFPGATLSVSANATLGGIVWGIDQVSGQLRAYDASNLAAEIYTSAQAPGGRDALGVAVKFTSPTVADGEVFVGTNNALVIYGVIAAPAPTVSYVDDRHTGWSSVGTWGQTFEPIYYYGGEHSFATGGNGADVATWSFSGLTPGSYRVSASWRSDPNRASNAPFSIFDGLTLVGSVLINQEQAPGSLSDQGLSWGDLGGPYNITGSTLTVTLSDKGTGANLYVDADAIRIERVGDLVANPPPPPPQPNPVYYVDDRHTGWSSVGTWGQTFEPIYYYGGEHSFATGGNGADVATWSFSGLTPGSYRVSASWRSDPNRASNAPFSIFDGLTLVGSVLINQEQAPGSLSDQGLSWGDLGGPYNVTGTTLTVTLSDKGTGANLYVDADAIRIERVGDLVANPPPPPPQPNPVYYVDDRHTGWSSVGTWGQTFEPIYYYGGEHSFATGGNGADVATWSFSGLTPGSYRVSASWRSDPNRASNAPFSIFDGLTLVGSVLINQEQAPGSLSDQGLSWGDLGGPYNITGSTLTVTLSDKGTGANLYVDADAIRIERVGDLVANPPPPPPQPNPVYYVDDRHTGWSSVGTWGQTFEPIYYYGGEHSFATGGNGADVATWSFSGLTPGSYRVSASWRSDPNRASNAPFSIFDGLTLVGSVLINQEQAPGSLSDQGLSWGDLGGPYNVTGTTLTVTLSDKGTGANLYVDADAIRIERVGS